jgi:hypothetical protein
MLQSRSSDAIYRLCIMTLIVVLVLYVGLVILPFFAYGLHLQSPSDIYGGSFDPQGFPLYDYRSNLGSLIRIVSVIVVVTAPIWMLGFGSVLTLTLARNWARLEQNQRRLAMLVLLAGTGVTVFTLSPLGRLILVWFFD